MFTSMSNEDNIFITKKEVAILLCCSIGTIDNYIHFAGEANAMGFFLMASLLGLGCLVMSIGSAKK